MFYYLTNSEQDLLIFWQAIPDKGKKSLSLSALVIENQELVKELVMFGKGEKVGKGGDSGFSQLIGKSRSKDNDQNILSLCRSQWFLANVLGKKKEDE